MGQARILFLDVLLVVYWMHWGLENENKFYTHLNWWVLSSHAEYRSEMIHGFSYFLGIIFDWATGFRQVVACVFVAWKHYRLLLDCQWSAFGRCRCSSRISLGYQKASLYTSLTRWNMTMIDLFHNIFLFEIKFKVSFDTNRWTAILCFCCDFFNSRWMSTVSFEQNFRFIY